MPTGEAESQGQDSDIRRQAFQLCQKADLDYTKALTEQAKEERQLMADDLYGFSQSFPNLSGL